VTDAHDRILENIRWQAVLCGQLGSPLAKAVLESVAENYASGGGARDILAAWPGDPFADNLTTRLLGGLHRLALDGQAPALAALYPSCGGQWSGEFLEDPVRTTLRDNTGFLSSYITLPPQTNEVRRSAALHGGFRLNMHSVRSKKARPDRAYRSGAGAARAWFPAAKQARLCSH